MRPPRPGSAAVRAGPPAGDRVLAADGREVLNGAELRPLQEAIGARTSGEAVELAVVRDGEATTVLAERP